jgi:hypothetical protein
MASISDVDVCAWDMTRVRQWAVEVVGVTPEVASKILLTGSQMLVGKDGSVPCTTDDLMGDLDGMGVPTETATAIAQAREDRRWQRPATPTPVEVIPTPITRKDVEGYTRPEVGLWARDVLGLTGPDLALVSKLRGVVIATIEDSQLELWPLSAAAKAVLRRGVLGNDWGAVMQPL